MIYMNILASKLNFPKSLMIMQRGSKPLSLAEGQIYEGTITSKEKGKLGIKLEGGFSFEAKADGVDKNIGDKVKLMAAKSEAGSITLRILDFGGAKNTDGALNPCQTKDLFKQSGFITEESINEDGLNSKEAELEDQARLAAAKIQAKLAYASDNLTMHAINELLASGVSIQKLNLSMLNSVMKQVKESPQAISDEAMDEIINQSLKDHGIDEADVERKAKFIKGLTESSLPVNSGNMEFMEKCLKIYEDTDGLSEGAIAQLIKIGGEITLSGLYSSNHIAALKNGRADLALLNKDLSRILDGLGLPNEPETRENATLLFEYDLPITAENMEKAQYLKNFEQNGIEQVIKAAARAIKEGVKPENAVLTDFVGKGNLEKAYKEIMEFLPKVTSRQIAYINSINLPVTLYGLRNINVPESFAAEGQSGDSRYMLIQIQHKLTNEAAQRLIGKGINIDTMPINKALNEVKAAEVESFARSLEDMGAEPSVQNISKLSQAIDAVRNLQYMLPEAYRRTAEGRMRFSINEISASVRNADVFGEFEKFMAEPDAAYGDSLDKAGVSIKNLVGILGLPANENNLKHAEILIKSGMDVTRENMLKISIIDLKVSKVYDELHPKVAAHMIKSGFDPLNSHVDSVLDYIENYNAEHGENPKDSIAEAIYELDKKGQLEESERKSLVALYKMMDRIEKDSFTSLGLNLKAGHMPTLRSLMDMAAMKTDIQREISDEGYTETLPTDTEKSLRAISYKSVNHTEEYSKLVMKSFAGKINKENLEKLMGDASLMDKPLEELVDFLLEGGEGAASAVDEERATAAFNDMKTVLEQKHDLFTFFDNIGVPATIGNIKTYLSLKGQSCFKDSIENITGEIEAQAAEYSVNLDCVDTTADNQSGEAMTERAEKLEQAVLDSGKAQMLKDVRLLQNAVKVQNAIAKRQNNFKIPVDIGGKAGQLNMFMPNGYALSSSQINLAVSINVGEVAVSAMCLLDTNKAEITLDIKGSENIPEKDIEKKLKAALKSFGLKGNIKGYGQVEGFSGQLDILPELGRNHKEAIFNIGKAMMKFADSII